MMTSNAIVLPGLTDWTKQKLTAIITARTQADFETAFEAFMSQDVSITSNGARLTREGYKQMLLTERSGEISGGVTFSTVVEAEAGENSDSEQNVVGAVGLTFQATIVFSTAIIGKTTSNIVDCSLNVTIIEDSSLMVSSISPIRDDSDPRRVSVLSEVITQTPNPLIPLST